MIIYERIFQSILQPFCGMWDDEEYVKQIEDFTIEDGIAFVKKEIIDEFAYKGVPYLNSRNVQMTLYYYRYCASEKRRDEICGANLIPLTESLLLPAIQEIYESISRNIGELGMVCSDFTENTELKPAQFYYGKDIIAYMSK